MPTNQTSYCQNCNTTYQNAIGDFCPKCGQRMRFFVNHTPGYVQQAPNGNYVNNGYPQQPTLQQRVNGGSSKALTISLIITAVILVGGIGATIFTVNSLNSSTSKKSSSGQVSERDSQFYVSMKLSTMESDTATLNMLTKEAVNTSKASIKATQWNGKTAAEATIHDICIENGIDDSQGYYSRNIGGDTYSMVWTDSSYGYGGDLKISGKGYSASGMEFNGSVRISDLEKY